MDEQAGAVQGTAAKIWALKINVLQRQGRNKVEFW
jgi:hypothetical protein